MNDTSDVETAATAMTDVEGPAVTTPKGSDSDKKKKEKLWQTPRFRLAAVGMALVVGIGCIVGGVVALTRPSPSSSNSAAALTNSKSVMDTVCSADSVSTRTGLEQCQEECRPALHCCNPFETDDSSCLTENLQQCVGYSKCQAVSGDVDPAPLNLHDICSLENFAENGKAECRKACEEVECCYSSQVESCLATNFLTCLDYAPCQNLRNETNLVPVAPSNIQETCFTGDEQECTNVCEPASCCFLDSTNENCLQSDFVSCLTYAPCGELLLPSLGDEIAQAPKDLSELCTIDNLLEDGYDQCAQACSAGDCCYSSSNNCFGNDPLSCVEYAPCSLLQFTGGDIPRAPKDLATICSWENLQSSSETAAKCAEACEPASCCLGVDNDKDNNCALDGNWFACAEYYPCTVLYITGGGLPGPPESIRQDCSIAQMEADGGLQCAVSCSSAECCFAQNDACLLGNADVCLDYMHSGCWRVPGWLNFDPYKDGALP